MTFNPHEKRVDYKHIKQQLSPYNRRLEAHSVESRGSTGFIYPQQSLQVHQIASSKMSRSNSLSSTSSLGNRRIPVLDESATNAIDNLNNDLFSSYK